MLGLCCCMGFSLVESRGYSLAAVHRLLTAVASLVAAPRLWSTGSAVVGHECNCSATCGIFPDQGSNLCLLHWQADSLPQGHQGSPSSALHLIQQVLRKCLPERPGWLHRCATRRLFRGLCSEGRAPPGITALSLLFFSESFLNKRSCPVTLCWSLLVPPGCLNNTFYWTARY